MCVMSMGCISVIFMCVYVCDTHMCISVMFMCVYV